MAASSCTPAEISFFFSPGLFKSTSSILVYSRSLNRLCAGIPALKISRQVELQADERGARSRTLSCWSRWSRRRSRSCGAILINQNRCVVLRGALYLDFIDDHKLFAALDVTNEAPHVLVLTFDRNHHGDSRIESLILRGHRFS